MGAAQAAHVETLVMKVTPCGNTVLNIIRQHCMGAAQAVHVETLVLKVTPYGNKCRGNHRLSM